MTRKASDKKPIFYKCTDSDEAEPIDALEWLKWCEETHGGKEWVTCSGNAEVAVQTFFTGLDRQLDDGPPLLFETVITGGPHHGHAWLSSTYNDAKRRHQQACEIIGFELPPRLRLT